ncbi:hypothetical protein [Moraxella caviae]|uniref:hypothetical protein n=1 Tax=Moraxella caviae TaxID=34060 RepID=UPI001559A681|nr:hypothetical protein [Moraxella caviae]
MKILHGVIGIWVKSGLKIGGNRVKSGLKIGEIGLKIGWVCGQTWLNGRSVAIGNLSFHSTICLLIQ